MPVLFGLSIVTGLVGQMVSARIPLCRIGSDLRRSGCRRAGVFWASPLRLGIRPAACTRVGPVTVTVASHNLPTSPSSPMARGHLVCRRLFEGALTFRSSRLETGEGSWSSRRSRSPNAPGGIEVAPPAPGARPPFGLPPVHQMHGHPEAQRAT